MIDQEKKKDRTLKSIGNAAWGVTVFVLVIFLLLTVVDFNQAMGQYQNGAIPYENVVVTIVPFLIILGCLSLVVAILMTVGRFMRLRTTNLLEIQQRLANLEEMVTTEKDWDKDSL